MIITVYGWIVEGGFNYYRLTENMLENKISVNTQNRTLFSGTINSNFNEQRGQAN